MGKFSIVIPCYNSSNTLSKCIKSVLDQDHKDFEIIVVLDGHNKSAESILELYPDVRVFYTEKEKSGAPRARNIGASRAIGDYVLFLDADSYLLPGALKHWNDIFAENRDIGFVYSGYRIVGAGEPYVSQDYDRYHLETNNYIDTSNPIKREHLVEWDESLKSLQDWDFWLRVTEKGVKGYYLRNYTYIEKEPPKEGSISAESAKDWVNRRKIVLKKNNLPIHDIAVTSFAAPHHAMRVAKLINADFVDPYKLFINEHEYKLVYLLGFFVGNMDKNLFPFIDSKTKKLKKDLKRVIHWIGSDIVHMIKQPTFFDLQSLLKPVNDKLIQFSQTEGNKKELDKLGFNSEVLHLPIDITESPMIPYPKDFTVGIYDHGSSDYDVYNQEVMESIIKAMPDTNFVYFGDNRLKGKDKNVRFLGYKPIEDIIKDTTVLLRITKHDGFPVGAIEFLRYNRPTITNVKMEYTFNVDVPTEIEGFEYSLFSDRTISDVKRQIVSRIRELKNNFPKPEFFELAKQHYKKILNPKITEDRLRKIIEN